MKKLFPFFTLQIFSLIISTCAITQNHIGLSTGNYSGVSSLWFNPSSIVDSRHKFDINLFSVNSYFTNNLFDVKRDAIFKRQFFKEPYNNNYNAVRADLLQLIPAEPREKVNMYMDSKIQYPLSMMISVGKNSAVALNLQSRMSIRAKNLDRSSATLLYSALGDTSYYNMVQDNSGFNYNYLRWQEAGLTFGTVLLNQKQHFIKAAFTGKWLMGQSAAHIQSDNLKVSFSSANQLSLQSPLISYYRSNNADIQNIGITSFFKDIEDNRFGWDVGLTYELRGRFKDFKYAGENEEVKERRDMNKYALRLGVALLDAGKFSFRKRALTNDHSANINNYNFSNVKANNFNEWDTAYSKLVQYKNGAVNNFDMNLPTAFSANLDVHLFRGYYINAAMYTPVELSSSSASRVQAIQWYAVTPRLETRHFGLYIPIVATPANNRTTVGATVRIGPLYIGSSNFGNYIFHDKLPTIDVHAGLKIGITYGKTTSFIKSLTRILPKQKSSEIAFKDTSSLYAEYKKALDSIRSIGMLDSLRKVTNKDSWRDEQRAPLVNVVVNNYLGAIPAGAKQGQITRSDSVLINNVVPVQSTSSNAPDSILLRKNADLQALLMRLEKSESRLQQLEQKLMADSIAATGVKKTFLPLVPAKTTAEKVEPEKGANDSSKEKANATSKQQQPVGKTPAKPVKKKVNEQPAAPLPANTITVQQPATAPANRSTYIVQTPAEQGPQPVVITVREPGKESREQLDKLNRQNEQLDEEINALRNELKNAMPNNSSVHLVRADTVERILRDTLIMVDTIRKTDTILVKVPAQVVTNIQRTIPTYFPIYFESGGSALSPAGIRVLEQVVKDFTKNNPGYSIHLTGRTDTMGPAELNSRLAQRRINAVARYLMDQNIPTQKISWKIQPGISDSPQANAEERRVDIDILSD